METKVVALLRLSPDAFGAGSQLAPVRIQAECPVIDRARARDPWCEMTSANVWSAKTTRDACRRMDRAGVREHYLRRSSLS